MLITNVSIDIHIYHIMCKVNIYPVSDMTVLCYNYLLSTGPFKNTAATTTLTKIGDQNDMSNKSMQG